MKTLFPGYYRPTAEEEAALWKECIFVFDANVLLNLYRYTPTTSKLFIDILRHLSSRLRIPYQVAKEYHVNRLNVIAQQSDAYRDIAEFILKHKDQLEAKLRIYKRHPYIDISKISSIVEDTYMSISVILQDSKKEHPDILRNDSILDVLTGLFEGVVGIPFSPDVLKSIYKEGEERFKESIPPGYMDAKNKDGDQKYGDLVLWFQIIEQAKIDQRPVIFITDDQKEDWWLKFRGMILGPHPNLVEEFYQKAGTKFYMYRSDQFMEYSGKYLSRAINQDAIDEVRSIRILDEMVSLRREKTIEEIEYTTYHLELTTQEVNDVTAKTRDIEKKH